MQWLLIIPILIVSIVVHEVAHAWVARREGDDTPERQGRITLNPLPHLDPVGSFLVPAILAALPGNFLFGWARPVMVDIRNYRDPVWSDIRVSMAGPASNLVLALLFTLLLVPAILLADGSGMGGGLLEQSVWVAAAYYGILINLILALFNLIPVPPLDGSHVMRHLLPLRLREPYDRFGRVGILVLLGVLFLVPGAIQVVMAPVGWVAELLLAVAAILLGWLR
jgi:Zn-dependent protease